MSATRSVLEQCAAVFSKVSRGGLRTPEGRREGAVDDQVGIAPDGRGEVRVGFEPEAVVLFEGGAVARLGHGPEDEVGHQLGGRMALRGRKELLEDEGVRQVSPAHRTQSQGVEEGAEGLKFLGVGVFVDTIEGGRLAAE